MWWMSTVECRVWWFRAENIISFLVQAPRSLVLLLVLSQVVEGEVWFHSNDGL